MRNFCTFWSYIQCLVCASLLTIVREDLHLLHFGNCVLDNFFWEMCLPTFLGNESPVSINVCEGSFCILSAAADLMCLSTFASLVPLIYLKIMSLPFFNCRLRTSRRQKHRYMSDFNGLEKISTNQYFAWGEILIIFLPKLWVVSGGPASHGAVCKLLPCTSAVSKWVLQCFTSSC